MDPYCQIVTPVRILPYYSEPRNNEAPFYSNLQLRMPTVTKMENIQNNVINIQIVLYTFIVILLLLVTSYIIFVIHVKYTLRLAISSDSLHTYTVLDTLDKNNTLPTITTVTQTESKSKKVSFDSCQKYQLSPP